MSSLITLQQLIEKRATLGRLILVTGNFNILHPGHIRLLKFARSCGDFLAVGISSDDAINNPSYNDEDHRADVVASLEFVDACFITSSLPPQVVRVLHPWAVVKGKEYEAQNNPEKEELDGFGGRLIFSSR